MKHVIIGGILGFAFDQMIGKRTLSKVITASLASAVITYYLTKPNDSNHERKS